METIKLSTDPVDGAKAFGSKDGVTAIAGSVNGRVALRGSMPVDGLTIEIGLHRGSGNLQWLRPVRSGSILLFPPGTEQDSVIDGPMSFLSCTVPEDFFHMVADRIGVTVPNGAIMAPRLYPKALDETHYLYSVHQVLLGNGGGALPSPVSLADVLVEMLIHQALLSPDDSGDRQSSSRYSLIVRRSRDWIEAHLDQKITVDHIAAAAATSRRTLHRAFIEILNGSPISYVQQLRLHRIRRELLAKTEAETTVAMVANHWEISELGRLSARYRALFGELPSQTLARS